jgi:transcriptional regulator with GAF, ATPase, and Fis domain
MKRLDDLLQVLARTRMSILIVGETGVGKEFCAERIHRRSLRAEKPFLKVNCAALPEQTLERELFGHDPDAFTGTLESKMGLIESADGGTVYLEDLTELSLASQAKLLRVLETGQVMRLGSVQLKAMDIRVIAATKRDIQVQVDRGLFRADLLFRVNAFTLAVPPLRERVGDVAVLAAHFLREAERTLGFSGTRLSAGALESLKGYTWPGNVRELRYVVERAALLRWGRVIEAPDLGFGLPLASSPEQARDARPASGVWSGDIAPPGTGNESDAAIKLRDEIERRTRERILTTLRECGGNQSRAARILGMARRTLLIRLDEYGVARPRKSVG